MNIKVVRVYLWNLRHGSNPDIVVLQVMVTEGPGGEESSVYDITLSEMWAEHCPPQSDGAPTVPYYPYLYLDI